VSSRIFIPTTAWNLKLEAERRAAGRELGALEGELPAFVMYGHRD
jgi:hypothetical protein